MRFRDSQTREKLWYSATHFIWQQWTPSPLNFTCGGICSCAVCVVLDKVPSRGHSLGWQSLLGVSVSKQVVLYRTEFTLLIVPRGIWSKNCCATSDEFSWITQNHPLFGWHRVLVHFFAPFPSYFIYSFSSKFHSCPVQFHSLSVQFFQFSSSLSLTLCSPFSNHSHHISPSILDHTFQVKWVSWWPNSGGQVRGTALRRSWEVPISGPVRH